MRVQPKEESESIDGAFMFRTLVKGLEVIYKSYTTYAFDHDKKIHKSFPKQ